MSSPGWYPDPAGDPRLERWWDGQQWTASTRNPPAPAPGDVTGGPSWPEMSPQQTQAWGQSPAPKKRTGLVVAVVALVLVLVGGGVTAFLLLRDGGGDPTAGPSGETSGSPSADPSADEERVLSSCPTYENAQVKGKGNRVVDGRISAPVPKGYQHTGGDSHEWPFRWAPTAQIAQRPEGGSWYSLITVSMLPRDGGYTTTKQTARSVAGCIMRSGSWFEYDDTEPVLEEPREIDGHEAWLSRIRIIYGDEYEGSGTPPPSPGAVMTVIAIDVGDPDAYAIFIADAPEGPNQAADEKQLEQVISGIRID